MTGKRTNKNVICVIVFGISGRTSLIEIERTIVLRLCCLMKEFSILMRLVILIFEHPHVFASWDDVKMGPFAKYNLITVETSGLDHQSIDPQDENRIKFFPETFPDLESTTETFPDD